MKKKFYFPDSNHEEEFFGPAGEWVCLDKKALREFAQNCEATYASINRLVHEATEEELAEYGKYEA